MSRPRLEPPGGATRLLLHACCAPCAGDIVKTLEHSGIRTTLFFYNPNIHPREEYERRKREMDRFARESGISRIEADYEPDAWFAAVRGLENEPERGLRCERCFELRLDCTAKTARDRGIPLFASTLGISRFKDMNQVNRIGLEAARRHPPIQFWDCNWRKRGGSDRMIRVSREQNFYRQDYCGCNFSKRPVSPS
jgi:hypothetical protein